jgi:DNA polymerase-1
MEIHMSGTALFIDGKNALYRAVYAVRNDFKKQIKNHYFVALLRQYTHWMNKYRPSSVHVFWDAPRKEVWRRDILKTYKEGRDNNTYIEDVSEDLFKIQEMSKQFFKCMNVRQYGRKKMEADDMIYAAAVVMHPQKIVIVSTDSDMVQIPFVFNNCKVYNPSKDTEVDVPDVNPAVQKALMGDKSDTVDGYRGIGPKKSKALLESYSGLREFLDIQGREKFVLNLMLIDLSLCPSLLINRLYIRKKLAENTSYSKDKIMELIQKYKVNGLMSDFADLVLPFSNLKE